MNRHCMHETIPCCGDRRAAGIAGEPSCDASVPTPDRPSALRMVTARLRRPFRFLLVGGIGLVFDVALFSVLVLCGMNTLIAGFLALVAATVLTWRLNRAFTFDRSGRSQRDEAMRYAAVTAVAQG